MDTRTDLTSIINDAITNTPRSLQTAIGPSELGMACDRCLIQRLAGHKPDNHHTPWLPTIGTAVHEWLETTIVRHLMTGGGDRWLPEARVTVGTVAGQPITGSCDLFDTYTHTLVDYKLVGHSTLKDAAANGPRLTYQRQAHLYGRGLAHAQHRVDTVAIWYLPRNGGRVDDGLWWETPYDPTVAEATLQRADMFATALAVYGPDEVLFSAGPHTGTEFTCPKTPSKPVTTGSFLGI